MSTPVTVKAQLRLLLNNANETTGNQDTTLTDGVNALVSGYGQSGSGDIVYGWILVDYVEIDGFYNKNGVLEPWDGVYCTGLVPVSNVTKVSFTQSNTKNHYTTFFAEDESLISYEQTSSTGTYIFDIPSNAAYFSVAYYEEERDTVNISVYYQGGGGESDFPNAEEASF